MVVTVQCLRHHQGLLIQRFGIFLATLGTHRVSQFREAYDEMPLTWGGTLRNGDCAGKVSLGVDEAAFAVGLRPSGYTLIPFDALGESASRQQQNS